MEAPRWIGLWHLTSLDAPTVAAVWALGFGWAAGVRLPGWILVLLALIVWVAYIFDRLLDVRASLRLRSATSLRQRHRFHWRHRKLLIPLAIAATCISVAMILASMPVVGRWRDAVLCTAGLAYFSGVHSFTKLPKLIPKELLVATLYTAACALPALNLAASRPSLVLYPAVFFVAVAWLNCHAIDLWERSDEALSARQILFPAGVSGLCGLVCATLFFPLHPRLAALFFAGVMSVSMLAILDRLRGRLSPLALRATADLVLLTPLLVLIR